MTGSLSFLYLIFVLNPIQMASVVLYPFSKPAFRSVNRWCARSIWGLWVMMAEIQNKIDVRITGDVPRRENAVILSNHQTMADVMVLLCFAWRAGRLGDLKWFVKDVIKYFPGFGWGMKFLDCIFVKRDWTRDKDGVMGLFEKYRQEKLDVFLISFLEGTRFTPEKHEKAVAFAKERGLPVPEHTLVPRTKGFVATMTGLRDDLDAVYDLTLGYETEPPPTLVNCFEMKVNKVDIHVKRYAISELPETEEELAAWARDRFAEKDALMAQFKKDGHFPGSPVDRPVRLPDYFTSERRLGKRFSGRAQTAS
jgi:1-acyl-sn-glycerol-3-phosphate acyltransferase